MPGPPPGPCENEIKLADPQTFPFLKSPHSLTENVLLISQTITLGSNGALTHPFHS